MENVLMSHIALSSYIVIGVASFFLVALIIGFILIWDISKKDGEKDKIIAKLQETIPILKSQVKEISKRKPSRVELQALIEDLAAAGAPEGFVKILEDVLFVIEDIEKTVNVQVQTNESLASRITSIERRITVMLAKVLCSVKVQSRAEIEKRMERVFSRLKGIEDINSEHADKLFEKLGRLENNEFQGFEERLSQLESLADVLKIFGETNEEIGKHTSSQSPPLDDTEPPKCQ